MSEEGGEEEGGGGGRGGAGGQEGGAASHGHWRALYQHKWEGLSSSQGSVRFGLNTSTLNINAHDNTRAMSAQGDFFVIPTSSCFANIQGT